MRFAWSLLQRLACGSVQEPAVARETEYVRRDFPELAPFLLRDGGASTSARSTRPGDAFILLVFKKNGEDGDSPVGRAMVLPVRWERDAPMSPRLPPGLRDLARKVAAEFVKSQHEMRAEDFGLRLAVGDADLSDWPDAPKMTWESGWGALFAGLTQLVHDVRPNPEVLLSVAWSSGRARNRRHSRSRGGGCCRARRGRDRNTNP